MSLRSFLLSSTTLAPERITLVTACVACGLLQAACGASGGGDGDPVSAGGAGTGGSMTPYPPAGGTGGGVDPIPPTGGTGGLGTSGASGVGGDPVPPVGGSSGVGTSGSAGSGGDPIPPVGGSSGVGTSGSAGVGGDPIPPPGELNPAGSIQTTTAIAVPSGQQLAIEDYFSTHFITGPAGSSISQQMYFDSCNETGAAPTFYASVSLGDYTDCENSDGLDRYGRGGCGGALIEMTYTDGAGLSPTGTVIHLPECIEAYGVAASSDCSTVAVLCRRENNATVNSASEVTKNSLLTHSDADWMTHPVNTNGDGRRMDEIWLYEWPTGDVTATPNRYVVHRAIGTSYGKYSLLLGDDNTYGIGVRSDLFGDNGTMHSADAMLVLDRATFDYTNRGYDWACGVGHTVTNFMGYNPASGKYAMHCLTDYNDAGESAWDMFIRLEDGNKDNDDDGDNDGYYRNYVWDGEAVAGAAALKPVSDGGWIGAVVAIDGADNTASHSIAFKDGPVPTSVGVARFDSSGVLVGDIVWLATDPDGLVSDPQLAELGSDRYLFGYGTMHRFASYSGEREIDYKVPHQYHVFEIDAAGRIISEQLDLPTDVGWGQWDEMVTLGPGRVAWAYVTPPTVTLANAADSRLNINRDALSAHVYVSSVR